ncbi:MAG: LysE family transporter [Chloroflexi bacterium]|nr:LysE family transporter [Chloroflexota bacterium]MBT5335243.1 LysE family transporter [Chloroflexota bacterium]MBT6989551.1 LysE family transporter [Chloroflexota bacterium]
MLKGLAIGFTGAAVLGPIGIIIIQRTLRGGWQTGIASGLGVALADGLFGLIGGLGLTAITSFMVGQQTWLRLIGGLILVIMGMNSLFTKVNFRETKEIETQKLNYLGDFSSIFLLTISNPMTILFFAGVYSGIGLAGVEGGWVSAVNFSLGVTLGSLFLWIVLSSGVNILRSNFKKELLILFSRLSGLIIIILGIGIVISSFNR